MAILGYTVFLSERSCCSWVVGYKWEYCTPLNIMQLFCHVDASTKSQIIGHSVQFLLLIRGVWTAQLGSQSLYPFSQWGNLHPTSSQQPISITKPQYQATMSGKKNPQQIGLTDQHSYNRQARHQLHANSRYCSSKALWADSSCARGAYIARDSLPRIPISGLS